MKKTTILLAGLACLCLFGFFILYWKPWRPAKYRWTFRAYPKKPEMEEVVRRVRGEDAELSFDERLHYWRELEKEKHSQRQGATNESFDERYPHGALAERVQRCLDMENILRQKYEIIITKEMLDAELNRIERSTRDKRRLEGYKRALEQDRGLLREILAKPYLVENRLRDSFNVDRSAQEERYLRAKALRRGLDAQNFREKAGDYCSRSRFWMGEGDPPDREKATALELRKGLNASNFRERAGEHYARLAFWLEPGRSPRPGMLIPSETMRAILTEVLKTPGDITDVIEHETSFQILMLASREGGVATVDAITVQRNPFDRPLRPDARTRHILTTFLKKPGEMTGVINQEASFQILMLASQEGDLATVDAITVPKVAFDEWLARERALLKIQRDMVSSPPSS